MIETKILIQQVDIPDESKQSFMLYMPEDVAAAARSQQTKATPEPDDTTRGDTAPDR